MYKCTLITSLWLGVGLYWIHTPWYKFEYSTRIHTVHVYTFVRAENVFLLQLPRVYNRKEGEYPTHYSTVYHPFTGVSDLSSIIHNLWYHTTPLTTTTWLYTKQLQVQLDSTHAEPQ